MPRQSGYFDIRFPTDCKQCGEKIEIGEWAYYDTDGNIIHRRCEEDAE